MQTPHIYLIDYGRASKETRGSMYGAFYESNFPPIIKRL
jgi:hypothetical protein